MFSFLSSCSMSLHNNLLFLVNWKTSTFPTSLQPLAFCFDMRLRYIKSKNESDHLLTTVGVIQVLLGTEQRRLGWWFWKLSGIAVCSNTTANSVTGGINSSVLIANTDPGRRLLSSALYNTLDATDKEKATERREGERVCRMCCSTVIHHWWIF